MTGYTVHTGTSKKFVAGWDRVFRSKPKAKSAGKAGARSAPAKTKAKTKKKS